jgi:glycogen debranching enzyme
MGPLTEWPKFLKIYSEKGYNMIHFTPLNHRGDSNSPYSIYNQLAFAPDLFKEGTKLEEQYEQISKMTTNMEEEFGLLSLTDVVWNHTAENSDWLQDHPEAGYNLHNSPHLIPAYQLDSALLEFSSTLRQLGYPTSINSIDDLLKIMEGIKTHVLGGLRLWEFYIIEATPTVSSITAKWRKREIKSPFFEGINLATMSLQEKAKIVTEKGLEGADSLGERFQRKLRSDVGASYLDAIFGEYNSAKLSDAQRDITNLINEINLPFYRQFDEDREVILENIFNRVKYVRLELKKEITEEYVAELCKLTLVLPSLNHCSLDSHTTSEPRIIQKVR